MAVRGALEMDTGEGAPKKVYFLPLKPPLGIYRLAVMTIWHFPPSTVYLALCILSCD